VLYGIDLARREIARTSQAVVVEGYTDVMACHLAGVGTAVATCGTAFGDDHARVLRRCWHDHEEFRGEVIFTFDGDAPARRPRCGVRRRPELRLPDLRRRRALGMDPCDLRLKQGDAAVRELIARRVPLYRFVLEQRRVPLRPRPGRRPGRRAARGRALVSSVRDRPRSTPSPASSPARSASTSTRPVPRYAAPRRKLVLQHPTVGQRRARRRCPTTSPTRPTPPCGSWSSRPPGDPRGCADPAGPGCATARHRPAVASALSALSVEPVLSAKEPDTAYVARTSTSCSSSPPCDGSPT
jgi:DNA primase